MNYEHMTLLSPFREIHMTLLSPFREIQEAPCDQPVLIKMPKIETMFVSVYDSEEKLHASMKFCNVQDYKIKRVTDSRDFVDSIIEQGYRV